MGMCFDTSAAFALWKRGLAQNKIIRKEKRGRTTTTPLGKQILRLASARESFRPPHKNKGRVGREKVACWDIYMVFPLFEMFMIDVSPADENDSRRMSSTNSPAVRMDGMR
jgi:hypothetical protein